MRFRISVSLLLLALCLPASASADDGLGEYCLSFINPQTTAAMCDPDRSLEGSLVLGAQGSDVSHTGAAAIDRPQALRRWEPLELSWHDASPEAALYVSGGGRSEVIPLSELGSRATVTLIEGDAISASGDAGSVIRPARKIENSGRQAETPQEAVAVVQQALADLTGADSMDKLCSVLDSFSRRFYLYFFGLPDQVGCSDSLKVFFLGNHGSSKVRPSESRLLEIVPVSSRLAYAELSLTHAIRDEGRIKRIDSRATVLFRRGDQGWGLANPQSLMPLNLFRFRSQAPAKSLAQATREWSELRAEGRGWKSLYLDRQFAFAKPLGLCTLCADVR